MSTDEEWNECAQRFSTVQEAIEHADQLLPGIPIDPGPDPRWQAIIQIGFFVETNPEEIWSFVLKWGNHEQEDLRDAIACVLLEHLLEYHFGLIFPRVETEAGNDPLFADMFCRCWKFGLAEVESNSMRFDALRDRIGELFGSP